MLKRIFIGAGVLLLPFAFQLSGSEQLRLPKAKVLMLLAALYFGIELARKVDRLLGISAFFCALSAYLAHTAFQGEDLLYVFAALSTAFWIKKPSKYDLQIFLKCLEFSGLICAAYAFFQIIGHDPIMNYYPWADIGRPSIFFGQHTLYGPWAVACFATALFSRHYWRSILLVLPIFFINSSFTFLSLSVVVLVFSIYALTRFAVLSMGVIIAIGLLSAAFLRPDLLKEPMNDKGRFALWGQSVELAGRRPLLGYGFGNFKAVYPVFQDKNARIQNGIDDSTLSPRAKEFIARAEHIRAEGGLFFQAHNEFIEAYFMGGIPGLILALLFPLSFFFAFYRSEKTPETWTLCAIFYSFMANAVGNFPMHLIPQALLPLWSYVAVTSNAPPVILEAYVESGIQRALSVLERGLRRSS